MRLLITLDFPPEKGGIQRYLSDIVIHTFCAEDLVITGGSVYRHDGNDRIYPCRILRIGAWLTFVNKKLFLLPMVFLLLYHLVRHFRHLIIYAGNIYTALVPGFISYVIPVHYCVYCYGTELLPLKKKRSFRALVWKILLRRADTIYYLTKTTRTLLEHCSRCAPLIQMFPRIDLPDYRVCRKTDDNSYIHLLSVGRLVPHKGHAILIEATALLPKEIPWQLTIVGDGPESRKLDLLVRQYSLEERIFLAGDVSTPELVEYYKAADIFVFPSVETESGIEGFGIVLLEAMAYGAAIVASCSESIEEVVDNNSKYVELVQPGNSEALKNALTSLMADSERRFRMASAARQFLEERYVWK